MDEPAYLLCHELINDGFGQENWKKNHKSTFFIETQWVSEIRTTEDFRHSTTVWFPNSSYFRHFCKISETWPKSSFFRHIRASEIWTHKKFGFQTFPISNYGLAKIINTFLGFFMTVFLLLYIKYFWMFWWHLILCAKSF